MPQAITQNEASPQASHRVGDALKNLRRRADLTAKQIAIAAGMPDTTYKNYEDRFSKPHLPVEIMQKLIPALVGRGDPPIQEAELMALAGIGTLATPHGHAPLLKPPGANTNVALPRDVPLLQTNVAGWGALWLALGAQPLDFLPHPPAISSTRALWAVTVADNALAPRYEIGERLYLDPNRPPSPHGYTMVIEQPDKEHRALAHLGRLAGLTDETVKIERLTPSDAPATQLPRRQIQSIARILTPDELLGG